ncbi:MAG: HAMP domain-containing sensor histidine kinase [Phenylobacterium sp.]|uniref:sensor histidine kinase n=1 Tax=Phenylobacterium sp. TaxID=1871053 RepID=UPI002735F354|nr:HAMP domain-containing sensor histidine kinase [Phenylobacterium sp.]MDP3745880.1 HAMP domain-containing sensor histidine kinase [Phenylobacterium sp.]
MASSARLGTAAFAAGIAWRAALIGVVAVIAVVAAGAQLYASALVLGVVIVMVGADLARASRSTDRILAQFVDGVAAQGYEWPRAPPQLARLGAAMGRAQARLEGVRAERQQRIDFLESLVDTSLAALLVVDDHGRVLHANRSALELGVGVGAPLELDVGAPGGRQIVRLADGRSALMQVSLFRTPSMVGRRLVSLQTLAGDLDLVEIKAQRDLVRILAHEMMNSLTPIASLSESLLRRVEGGGVDEHLLSEAMEIISRRSAGLMTFVERYRRVAEVLPGAMTKVSARDVVARLDRLVAPMMAGAGVRYVCTGAPTDAAVEVDADLLEQALLNLLINARDAAIGRPEPQVSFGCMAHDAGVGFVVSDNGPGLADPEAAFVPFYTTKPQGSGIGLTLARQIATAHGGRLDYQRENECTTFVLQVPAPK